MDPTDAPIPFDVTPDPYARPAGEAIDGGTLARAESGDRRAIERVLRTVHPSVHRTAHALAGDPDRAADVMRFVFASAMRVLPQWSGWVDPETWFAHQAVQAVRRVCVGRPAVEHDLLVTALPPDVAAGLPTDDWSQAAGRTGIRSPAYLAFVRAVRRLPPQQAEAFVLHHGERLNARLLGVAMDCSAMAAETHLRAATAALKPLAGDDLPRLAAALHKAARALTPTPAETDEFVRRYVGAWAGRRARRRLRRVLATLIFVGAVAAAAWVFRIELRTLFRFRHARAEHPARLDAGLIGAVTVHRSRPAHAGVPPVPWDNGRASRGATAFGLPPVTRGTAGDTLWRMAWAYYAILVVLLLCGIGLNVLTLPGNWLMLLAALGYGWLTGWRYVGLGWLVAFLVVAALAEVVEFASAGKAAAKVGGSRWGSLGAVVGGLLGGLFLTALIPFIFPLNTIAGILAGTFLGSSAGELVAGKRVDTSLVIGAAATKGRLVGTILKVAFGVLIALVAMVVALPVW